MPTISAKIIRKPRKIRFCEGYRHYVLMGKGEPTMRIYGSAFYGEPKFSMYLCLKCAGTSDDVKTKAALHTYEEETT